MNLASLHAENRRMSETIDAEKQRRVDTNLALVVVHQMNESISYDYL